MPIIDQYGQKLLNSGYTIHQTRKTIVNGIKSYESRKIRCRKEGRKFRRTGKESLRSRQTAKLLQKTSWYKKGGKEDCYNGGNKTKRVTGRNNNIKKTISPETKRTVLFVENSPGGGLAKTLREVTERLLSFTNMNIKVVEKTGKPLKSQFPQDSWNETICGRSDCIPCNQCSEHVPNCTKRSVIYENMCSVCNPGAKEKKEIKASNPDIPSIYVGETARSIKERIEEHHQAYKSRNQESHIMKHQLLHHQGADPEFIVRVVDYKKTALTRQLGEAVRIRRRGGEGAVLNSKGEFNRCRIPRLVVEETEETEKLEEQRVQETMKLLDKEQSRWETNKLRMRDQQHLRSRSSANNDTKNKKRAATYQKEQPNKKIKRRKYMIIGEAWGTGSSDLNIDKEEEQPEPEPPLPIPSPLPVITQSTKPSISQNTQPPCSPPLPTPPSPKEQLRKGATTPAPKRAANRGPETPKSRRTGSTIQNYLGRSSQKHGRGPPAPAGRSYNKTKPTVSDTTLAISENVNIEEGGCDTITPTYHNITQSIPSSPQDHTSLNNKKQKIADTAPPVAKIESIEKKKAGKPKQIQTGKKNVVVVADPKQRKLTEMFSTPISSDSSSTITPAKKIPCTYNKNGFCKQHRVKAQSRTISSLELQDRGGGRGMGLVKIKKEIFLCNPKKLMPEVPKIPTKSDNKVYLTNGLVAANNTVEVNNFDQGRLLDYTSNIGKGLASNRMDESESSELGSGLPS